LSHDTSNNTKSAYSIKNPANDFIKSIQSKEPPIIPDFNKALLSEAERLTTSGLTKTAPTYSKNTSFIGDQKGNGLAAG